VPIPLDSTLTEGTLTPVRRIASPSGERCSPGLFSGRLPLQSSISLAPLDRTSQPEEDCGSRVHLIVLARQATERRWSYSKHTQCIDSDLASEGRLQLPPDDSVPNSGMPRRLGDEDMLAVGEQRVALETAVGAQDDTVRRAHGEGQLERAEPVSQPTRLRCSERTQAT
jgi:hypothetical protein